MPINLIICALSVLLINYIRLTIISFKKINILTITSSVKKELFQNISFTNSLASQMLDLCRRASGSFGRWDIVSVERGSRGICNIFYCNCPFWMLKNQLLIALYVSQGTPHSFRANYWGYRSSPCARRRRCYLRCRRQSYRHVKFIIPLQCRPENKSNDLETE